MSTTSLLAIATLAALFMGGCAPREAQSPATDAPISTGEVAVDFTGHDLDGKAIQLSRLRGKQVVLLSFSVTFCEPCVAELPHLQQLYDENKANGLVVLGIAMDGPETISNVPAFARRHQLNFPVITDEDAQIWTHYNPTRAAPLSVLIDRSGKITMVRRGYAPGDEKFLREAVEEALAAR
jgi:peroxiredoxin